MQWFDRLVGRFLIALARILTGAYANWLGCRPEPRQRLYFANHSSHLDFLLLWAMLPPSIRYQTRPVAGADYWGASSLRRYLIHRVFRGVLVERARPSAGHNPLAPLQAALDAGDSLIFFPEGTRSLDGEMQAFKGGLYHLARDNPQVEFVPVRMENLNRVMPKGNLLPVPLVCILSFGAPVGLGADEAKPDFLVRARQAVLDMMPKH
ncbi:lysophospholipid acyltransferase family protein [Uliginosibacterium sp. 31-16]|uniref:lysophospholipid acyltransferase family protein n=1 Tax=Uliginosibacterium sp. 31-16 TaxID=3068315 RepID=UPI00273E15EA|nr:lysophospholipid acyltransferase family protein [Uliginosibacterium sp. 31-16]MDP5239956.1 lysophospholipid acyltransferase family protein [Uliginosibacterium sp. 31-16]